MDRATWDAAQRAGAEQGTTWDGLNPYPSARRTYALRSRIRCKLCKRRMCGIIRTHPDREHGDDAYYICQFDPGNPRHVAAAPDHPRTVAAREDLLLDALRDGLFTYALGPGRAEHLAELLPADATAKQAQTITDRLNASPAAWPPPDPAAGWSIGGVAAMLRNPKYTGYQVIGRRRKGRLVPIDQWHWSTTASHPAIIDRATWDAAQTVGAEHATSWDGAKPYPSARRSYALRSRIRCKVCKRRMCGATKTHPDRPGQANAYYVCQYDPANPRHVATAPDHPRTVSAREDVLLHVLRDFLAAYTLTPAAKNGSPNCSRPMPPPRRPRRTRRPPPWPSGSSGSMSPRTASSTIWASCPPTRPTPPPTRCGPHPRPLHRPAPPARNHRDGADGPRHHHRPRR